MTPAARLFSVQEILSDIITRRRPAPDALKDWALSHRFAGSGDRAAMAAIVYDCLRCRQSAAWQMDGESSRELVLGMLKVQRALAVETVERLFSGDKYASAPLTGAERALYVRDFPDGAPLHIAGDFPEWATDRLLRVFGESVTAEMHAMAKKAPLDMRVNKLAGTREEALNELQHYCPLPTPCSPLGVRILPAEDAKAPPIQSEPAYLSGLVEIQDEGSQLVTLLVGAGSEQRVVDLCAGGGGKTLALAAEMNNSGMIFATDRDIRRLAPIHQRLQRAGVRNVEVRTPRGGEDVLEDIKDAADLVFVDAPCTGTGAWRRNPDAKWRLRPGSLEARVKEQAVVLDRAAGLVKPGGRIAYVTCSLLADENDDAVEAFLKRMSGFAVEPAAPMVETFGGNALVKAVRFTRSGMLMTPLKTGTDGFYLAVLRRAGDREPGVEDG